MIFGSETTSSFRFMPSLFTSGHQNQERSQAILRVVVALFLCATALFSQVLRAAQPSLADYSAVDSILSAHCLDCHAGKDPEGQLVLDNFEALMKGGEIGPAVIAGKSSDSMLVQMIEGRFEKAAKRKSCLPASALN